MGVKSKNLGEPDEVERFPGGRTDEVHLGELTVGRSVYEPGWRWSTHVKPIVGTPSCQLRHVGSVISGRMHVVFDDGSEGDLFPGDIFEIAPGHDAWVVGDEPCVDLEWAGVHGWTRPMHADRVLATVLLTDIVDSTATAGRLGDGRWSRLLADHNDRVRAVLDRHRGREMATTGDGILAIFDGAERAVRGAAAIGQAVRELDLTIRAAVHTGEIEIVPGNVRGLAIHVAARILSLAGPDEVLVSRTTRDLIDSRDLPFVDRGEHELRGVSGARRIYALER